MNYKKCCENCEDYADDDAGNSGVYCSDLNCECHKITAETPESERLSTIPKETKDWEEKVEEFCDDCQIDGMIPEVKSFISNLLKSESQKIIKEIEEFVKNYNYKDNTIIFVMDLEKFFIQKLKS